MDGSFLAVYKELYGLGLKSVDILIISQINEYQKQGLDCYVTNEQLSNWFGESESTIKRAIKKLDELNVIDKKTSYVEGNGRGNCQRVMKLNPKGLWKIDSSNDGRLIMTPPNNGRFIMDSPSSDGRFKSEQWEVHNEPIKENLKEKSSIRKEQNAEQKRDLEELDDGELLDIKQDFENKMLYNDIGAKYNIKQKYLNKDIANRISNILFNRECANRIMNDSSTAVIQDDTSAESLSDYINEDEANEILDTFESCGDDNRKAMRFKQVLPKKYGIPESVMKQYLTHDDFINELENIAA